MRRFVEGADRGQTTLLPECLGDWVEESNPVRAVDVFVAALDLADLGFDGVQPLATGRPAYHPSTLLKLYIYGYLNRVQSSRRLEREAGRNLEVMWLTGESEDKLRQIIDTDLTWSAGSNGSEGKNAEAQPGFMAQMRAVLNVLPAYVWYGTPSGVLTFVNKRQAEFLGVPNDHPLRFGIDTGAQWDDWIPFLHPDEHEEARKYWSNCRRTGKGDEHHHEVQRHGDGAVDLPVYRRRPRGPAVGRGE
jgi:PAS domain-containing protein